MKSKVKSNFDFNLFFLQFVLINIPDQLTAASPLFFDSWFPSLQATTPESVVADYRQRKRADSRAEHANDDHSNDPIVYNGNNAEFVAEVIGKLIGTIRDGVTTFIEDVRARKGQKSKAASEAMSQKLTNATEVYSSEAEVNKTTTTPAPSTTSAPLEGTKELSQTQLASSTTHRSVPAEVDSKNRGSGKIQSANESSQTQLKWDDVVQVIARTKHKRSDSNAQQFEIPINSDSMVTKFS